MFKFLFKSGVTLGIVYYVNEQGLWRESTETTALLNRICIAVNPYWEQIRSQSPVQIPNLPKTDKISYILNQSWNKGVSATFVFLGNLPDHINNLTDKGIDVAMKNEEIKKFVSSFSNIPQLDNSSEK